MRRSTESTDMYSVEEKRFSGTAIAVICVLMVIMIILICCLIFVGIKLSTMQQVKDNEDEFYNRPDVPILPPPAPNKETDKAPGEKEMGSKLRLPKSLEPESYKMKIRSYLPSPDNLASYDPSLEFTFDGFIEIVIYCKETTDKLVLNSLNLNITEETFTLWKLDGVERKQKLFQSRRMQILREQQMIMFHLQEPLMEGSRYQFSIYYRGSISNELNGYYRSSYVDEFGATRWLAVTKFEPNDARKAVPCFDEPPFKATFQLIMEHPQGTTTLFNAPEDHAQPKDRMEDGWVQTRFKASPKMSSYLLAYVVSSFKHIETFTADGKVKFGAWCRPTEIHAAEYANVIGPKILTFYEEYFKIKFPLQKMDQIAVPDFKSGAMENWGLISYAETAMLYDPGANTLTEKLWVTTVISHELSHQVCFKMEVY